MYVYEEERGEREKVCALCERECTLFMYVYEEERGEREKVYTLEATLIGSTYTNKLGLDIIPTLNQNCFNYTHKGFLVY